MAENAELRAIIKAEVEQAVNAFKKFDDSVKKTSQSVNKGSAAATDFTRVLQDAPFGIIGVGNNIQQLADSFGRLKESTGSTGGALKALVGSLAGPGGIAFAITAITTALTFAQVGLANWTRKSKEAKEKQDEWAKAQHNTAVAIEKQRIETENLIKVARGDIGTKKEQQIALERLNQLIPDNIGVLTEQNIKTAEGARITSAYVQALTAQATAQLLVNKSAELTVANLEEQQQLRAKLLPLFVDQDRLQKKLATASKNPRFIATTTGAVETLSEFAEIQQEIEINQKKINDLQSESQATLTKNFQQIFNFSKQIDSILPKATQLQETIKKTKPDKPEEPFKELRKGADETKTALIPLKQILDSMLKGGVQPSTKLGLQVITPEMLQRAKEWQALLNEQNQQLTSIANVIGSEVAGAFNQLFDSAIKGEDLFKSLTDAVKQLVFNLIKAVAQALILEAIASAFGLKGGGTFLNGLFAGGTALQNKGVVASGLGGQPAMIAVGTLRGQDILLSVQRTERSNFING